jgi:hypothetical protein
MHAMGLTEAQVQVVLDELRDGRTVSIGGSRCNTTYGWRDGAFYAEAFDEGHVEEHASDEGEVRRWIERDPAAFASLAQAPDVRAFREAWARDDREGAVAALRRAEAIADPLHQFRVFAAALLWPDRSPTDEERAMVREMLTSQTAWHAFLSPVGWELTPERGRQGVAYLDRLLAMVPEPRGYETRASFHELAGDLDAAIDDLWRSLAETPDDAWWRPELVERIAKLEAKRQAAR